jgi:hypothetical protein
MPNRETATERPLRLHNYAQAFCIHPRQTYAKWRFSGSLLSLFSLIFV